MTCKALLVWSRTNAYKMPHTVYCDLSHASNQHLSALVLYFGSLSKLNTYLSAYLHLGSVEFNTKAIGSFLESATLARCADITINAYSRSSLPRVVFPKDVCCLPSPTSLHFVRLQLPTLFSHSLLRITLATLLSSPLQELSLVDIDLTPRAWSTLLALLTLPDLHSLEVEEPFPVHTLTTFLGRHPHVNLMTVCVSHGQRPKGSLKTPVQGKISLLQLKYVHGPVAYVSAFGAQIDTPDCVTSLILSLTDIPSQHRHLLKILNCLEMFLCLEDLQIYFETDQSIAAASLALPEGENHTCGVKHLQLSCFTSHTRTIEILVSFMVKPMPRTHTFTDSLHQLANRFPKDHPLDIISVMLRSYWCQRNSGHFPAFHLPRSIGGGQLNLCMPMPIVLLPMVLYTLYRLPSIPCTDYLLYQLSSHTDRHTTNCFLTDDTFAETESYHGMTK